MQYRMNYLKKNEKLPKHTLLKIDICAWLHATPLPIRGLRDMRLYLEVVTLNSVMPFYTHGEYVACCPIGRHGSVHPYRQQNSALNGE